MADAVASQTIMNGPRKAVMKFTNVSDGTGESAVKKVDASDLGATMLKIDRIYYATSTMSVRILWDATTDVDAFVIGAFQTGVLDFTPIGGLINNAGTGVTGDINFTTIGHTAGANYSIILEMSKT